MIQDDDTIDLGVASTDTQGSVTGQPEEIGLRFGAFDIEE